VTGPAASCPVGCFGHAGPSQPDGAGSELFHDFAQERAESLLLVGGRERGKLRGGPSRGQVGQHQASQLTLLLTSQDTRTEARSATEFPSCSLRHRAFEITSRMVRDIAPCMETTSDDALARLAELAELADAGRTAFLALAESAWRPTPGSAAASTKTALAGKDPAVNSDGILAGFDLVSEVVVTFVEVAANHLGGLAALYHSNEIMFSPLPLVRSVLEYSAHAMWVLGDGTGKPDDMLARAYLEDFDSSEYAKMAAGRMNSKADASHQQAEKRWKEVRQRAIAAFPDTTLDDLGTGKPGRTIANQTLPSPEGTVSWMFDLIKKNASGSVDEVQGKGVYAFLSSGAHASLYQARQLRKYVDRGDYIGTILATDVQYVERLLVVGVVSFYNALSYTMSFYGLSSEALDAWTEKIDAVVPGVLKAPPGRD
jgi:hypothetical protein